MGRGRIQGRNVAPYLGTAVRKGPSEKGCSQGGQHRHHQHPGGAVAALQHAAQHGKEQKVGQQVLEADVQERCKEGSRSEQPSRVDNEVQTSVSGTNQIPLGAC